MKQVRYGLAARVDATNRTVEGVLIPLNTLARVREAVSGRQVIERIVGTGVSVADDLVLNLQHVPDAIASRDVQIDVRHDSINLRAVLDGDLSELAASLLSRGTMRGLSAEFLDVEREQVDGVSEVRALHITGASLVDVPAYAESQAQLRAAIASGERRGLMSWA